MAVKKKLSPNQLAELKASFAGLKSIGDYAPVKAEFAINPIQTIENVLDELILQEAQKRGELDDLRDQIADKGKEYAQKMKGAAQQVVAQYGDDSAEIQKLGRKRTSERSPRKPNKGNGEPD